MSSVSSADVRGAAFQRTPRWLVPVACLIACAALLLGDAPWDEPFGDSHDGRNGAVWTAGAEAFAHDPIGSRLGAVRSDGTVYANHPPAILALTAVTRSVVGDRPLGSRAVAISATLLGAALVGLLLRDLGFGTGATLLGLGALATTPMLRVYGTMLDTPIVGLPLAVQMVRIAVGIEGRRPRAGDLVVFALAPLVAWQLTFLGLLVVGRSCLRRAWGDAARLGGALVAGLITLLAWLLWVHGSIGPVIDQLRVRSSLDEGSGAGILEALDLQSWAVRVLVGPAMVFLLAAAGAVFLSRRLEVRIAGSLGLLTVFGYDLVLSNGAANHDYWGYWILIPVSIGAAALPDLIRDVVWRTGGDVRRAVRFTGGVAALTISAAVVVAPPQVAATQRGADAARAVSSASPPPSQNSLWILAEFDPAEAWVADAASLPAQSLTEDRIQALAAAGHDDDIVIVSTACPRDEPPCDRIPFEVDNYLDRRFHAVHIRELLPPPGDR